MNICPNGHHTGVVVTEVVIHDLFEVKSLALILWKVRVYLENQVLHVGSPFVMESTDLMEGIMNCMRRNIGKKSTLHRIKHSAHVYKYIMI